MTRRAPIIGDHVDGTGPLAIDFDRLIVSRLLVQANSGGGKSWAVRRLLEQTYGLAQQIVIDPEDEFYTLREKHDYVLAGRDGGDCPAEPRSAHLLARYLLELNVSCIIGIYELGKAQRREFVKRFLTALVNAPKHLWHPALVVVDEAHDFCPEGKPSDSSEAVIDLATKGRKRGFCAVLATQRISKLSKDAAAELNNKLVGRCVLDIDRKRAGEELGFTAKEDVLKLRDLQEGEFFAFGPALSRQVVKIKTGPVFTTHPDPLKKGAAAAPPPPSEKVRSLLSKLAELPQEAVQEAHDVVGLRKQVADLQRQLRQAAKPAPAAAPAPKNTAELGELRKHAATLQRALDIATKEAERQVARAVKAARAEALEHGRKLGGWERRRDLARELDRVMGPLNTMQVRLADLGEPPAPPEHWAKAPEISLAAPEPSRGPSSGRATPSGESRVQTPRSAPPPPRAGNGASEGISGPQQRVLDALAWLEAAGVAPAAKLQVALLAEASPSSSSFTNNLGALRTAGLIDYPGPGAIALTEDGHARAAAPGQLGPEDIHLRLEQRLPGPQWRIVAKLIEIYPQAIDKNALADLVGASVTSSSYTNNLGALRSLGVLDYPSRGQVVARPVLFLERD
jgi:uncharacterized protein DUF87